MSRSFTTRPSVTNTRGRGRGAQTRQFQPQPINSNRTADMNPGPAFGGRGTTVRQGARPGISMPRTQDVSPDVSPERQRNEPEMEQRMTYQGGYTVIAPNQKKRQQVSEVAQREMQAYEAHKQQNTQKSFNYVGTIGGQTSQAEARQKTIQTTPNKTQKLLKNEERKSYFKQKEEEETQKKKDEQRRKAQQNEARRKEQEEAASHKWDDQKRRTNEAFLNRLETKSKPTSDSAVQRTPQTTAYSRQQEPVKEDDDMGATAAVGMDTQPAGNTRNISGLSSEQTQRVAALAAIFPQLTQAELLEALRLVGYSLDAAIDLLQ